MNEQTPLWERKTDESSKHYAWFYAFLLLDSERSMLSTYKSVLKARNSARNPATVPSSWREVARQHQWKERAAAWDVEQRRVADVENSERRANLRDRALDIAEQMLERVEEMLRFPIEEVVSVDGKTIIKPAKWTFDTVPKLMAMVERVLVVDDSLCTRLEVEPPTRINSVDIDAMDDATLMKITALFQVARQRAESVLSDENASPLRLVG